MSQLPVCVFAVLLCTALVSVNCLSLLTIVAPSAKNDQNILVKELPDGGKAGPAFDVRIFNLDFFPKHLNFTLEEIIPTDKVRDEYDVFEFKSGRTVGRFSKTHRFFYDMDLWSLFRWKVFPVAA